MVEAQKVPNRYVNHYEYALTQACLDVPALIVNGQTKVTFLIYMSVILVLLVKNIKHYYSY